MAADRCFGAANVSWLMQRAVEKVSVPQNTTTFTISLLSGAPCSGATALLLQLAFSYENVYYCPNVDECFKAETRLRSQLRLQLSLLQNSISILISSVVRSLQL